MEHKEELQNYFQTQGNLPSLELVWCINSGSLKDLKIRSGIIS